MRSKMPAAGTMTGGCLCGAIRYEVTGEPIFSTHCHCRDCQRASGSAYIATARLPAAGFRITKGSPKRFVGKADSGNEVTRVFCGDCGSPLYSKPVARPDMIGIYVGGLDDPSGFRPDVVIFASRGQPWDHLDPALPRLPHMRPSTEGETGSARRD